jgi:predicted ATPase
MSYRASIHTPIPHEPSFVGRADYLQTIADLIEDGVRIVTIAGPGGVGKTTLAARFAEETRVFDSVVFVPLAEVMSADGMASAVAESIGVELSNDEDPLQQLAVSLGTLDSTLLILDNLEQMTEVATKAVSLWIRATRDVRVVVTSRTPLNLREERTVDLAPLSTDDAVRLFGRHARANTSGDSTRALVEALDNLPLAVVLAASIAHVMPPEQMLNRLDDSLEILRSRDPMIEDRHSSLFKAIDWSWDMLEFEQKQLLGGLTVFRGGFTVDDVVAVLLPESSFVDTLDRITELLDTSMVARSGSASPARFELMNSITRFVEYHAPRVDPVVYERHARRFVERSIARLEHQWSRLRGQMLEETRLDLDNLFVAWERTEGSTRADVGVAIVRALSDLGAADRLDTFLDEVWTSRLDAHQKLEVLTIEARYRFERAQVERARAAVREGLELAEALGEAVFLTRLKVEETKLELRAMNMIAAAQAAERACAVAARTDDLVARVEAARWRAKVDHEGGDLSTARDELERALGRAESADVPHLIGLLLVNLAEVDRDSGQHASEERRLLQARTVFDNLQSRRMVAGVDFRLGCLLRRQHRLEEALPYLEDSAHNARRLGLLEGAPFALVELGTCLHQLQRFDDAKEILEEALELSPGDRLTFADGALAVLALERGNLDAAREHARSVLDHGHALGQTRFDGVARTTLAIVAWREGKMVEAGAFLDAALADAEDAAEPVGRREGGRHDPMAYALRGAMAARSGDFPSAERAYDRAVELASEDDFRDIPSAVALLEGVLEVARGQAGRAQQRLAAASTGWRICSIETRICAQLLEDELAASDAPAAATTSPELPTLLVHPEGDQFRLGEESPVDISRRRAHRHILAALARARSEGNDRAFDVYELFEIGWPSDRRTAPDVGARRVYTTIRELRDLGLEDVLVTSDDGYLLDGVNVQIT